MTTNSIPQAVFGPGSIYVTRNDNAGPNTPVNIGYAQEFQYEESAETKELFGQNQYPLVVARGTVKTSGKMKAAVLSGIALNAVFWGQTLSTGQLQMNTAANTAIPTTPFQITPAVPGSGTWEGDLGVIWASGANVGLPLAKVASAPATGQYSVAAGVYTFAAADVAIQVSISFSYTTTGAGQKIIVTNTAIGTTPTFQLDYVTVLYGASYYIRFYVCISQKLIRTHKLTDFMNPEVDFAFFPNAAGQVFQMSAANAS